MANPLQYSAWEIDDRGAFRPQSIVAKSQARPKRLSTDACPAGKTAGQFLQHPECLVVLRLRGDTDEQGAGRETTVLPPDLF